ncbi:MAG: OmpA family protein [Bacteroidetes bacterium]|nr:OmpA family protein [Bacteroidota bacterium]MCB0842534.1 OmpA family protein [Bacteroidota bacterium]MCB0854199.1 OmpA family protein [Bacteroidota bacterium]
MKQKKRDSSRLFWISYADLMTALFIVVLALFVFAYKMFKIREDVLVKTEEELRVRSLELDKQNQALEEVMRRLSEEELHASSLIQKLNDEKARLLVMEIEYRKLQEIQKAIENLDPRYFVYQPEYKRHVLRTQVQFDKGKSDIKQPYKPILEEAGKALRQLVDQLEPNDNIKYLMVIEGMASRDDYTRNYELSYERALSLVRLWEEQGITFDQDRVEVMISGSGEGGVGRNMDEEVKNQRFLIQIIPKIGELKGVEYENSDSLSNDVEEEEIP